MELIYCLIYCSPTFKKSQCWHRILNTFISASCRDVLKHDFQSFCRNYLLCKESQQLENVLRISKTNFVCSCFSNFTSHPVSPKLYLSSALSFLWALSLKNSWGCATVSLKYVSQHTTFHLETLKWAVVLDHSKCSSNKPLSTCRKIKECPMFIRFEKRSPPSSHLTYLLSNQTVWTFIFFLFLFSVSIRA